MTRQARGGDACRSVAADDDPLQLAELYAAVPGQRVLVVDDDCDSAELFAELLERGGYTVRVAFDASSALSIASDFVPDAAVLDIGLPIVDGYELAVRLRTIASLRHLILVAVTGYGHPSDERRAREAGFDAHLVKPHHVSKIGPVLRRLLWHDPL
jgi:CheY-like chemotaxis protein